MVLVLVMFVLRGWGWPWENILERQSSAQIGREIDASSVLWLGMALDDDQPSSLSLSRGRALTLTRALLDTPSTSPGSLPQASAASPFLTRAHLALGCSYTHDAFDK